MSVRQPVTLPTRDVVRILSIIFGFYIGIRLLWVAHPVVRRQHRHHAAARTGWRREESRAGPASRSSSPFSSAS